MSIGVPSRLARLGSLRLAASIARGVAGQRLPNAVVEGAPGRLRDHPGDVAAERRDLLDEAGTDVAVLDRGHEEDRVDLGRQDAIVVGELHLRLEVADRPQAADDRGRAAGTAEVDREAVEGLDLDLVDERPGVGAERLADDRDPRLDRQQRRLPRVGQDADDHGVEDGRCPGRRCRGGRW